MQTFTKTKALQAALKNEKAQGNSIAFVPTMGNLHRGHEALIQKARELGHKVVVSIFVNPLQFGENEDYQEYPRSLEQDKQRLEKLAVDYLLTPKDEEVYPNSPAKHTQVWVPEISESLCGKSRPGHFQGVATIVLKLINITLADYLILGEKDFQQLKVIQRLCQDLSVSCEVIPLETVREPDGLAKSSRNKYLSPSQRAVAPKLFKQLQALKQKLISGDKNHAKMEAEAIKALSAEGFEPDYLKVCHTADLSPAQSKDNSLIILAAVKLGQTRLIDNLRVDIE